jgi:hypothetical protein
LTQRGLDSGYTEFPHLIAICCDNKRFDALQKVNCIDYSRCLVVVEKHVHDCCFQLLGQLPPGTAHEADILPFVFKKLVDVHEFKAAEKVRPSGCVV